MGLIALISALPIMMVAALFIYLEDPGPVFYVQTRRGLNGKPVRILKLRSMYKDSQTRLEELLATNPDAAAEWYSHYKLSHDPRVLPGVGHFIRKYSIDELPQILSVLRGDLSLIGPRVFVDYDLAAFSPPELALRQSVLPGLTGLWQISVRSEGSNSDKVLYDLDYVRNWSLWQDLCILIKTIGVVIKGRGAV